MILNDTAKEQAILGCLPHTSHISAQLTKDLMQVLVLSSSKGH